MFLPKKWFWGGHLKPCPFGVELPNCTFLMELFKIVSRIHAGEDCWAGASAGALSLCCIISSKTKFIRCTVHLAIIGELQVLLLVLLPQLVRGWGCWIATIRCTALTEFWYLKLYTQIIELLISGNFKTLYERQYKEDAYSKTFDRNQHLPVSFSCFDQTAQTSPTHGRQTRASLFSSSAASDSNRNNPWSMILGYI